MIRERNGIKELEIFWSFERDITLPKFNKQIKSVQGNFISFNSAEGSWDSSDDESYVRMNIFKKFFLFLYKKFVLPHKIKKINDRALTTILNFFTSLASNFSELSPLGEIADVYEKAYTNAVSSGQKALQEKIKNILDVARTEAHLIENGLTKYINEDQIIEFYEAAYSHKNLKLTWIKNFARVIPTNLIELKKQLDEKELFDNYVILHYDPYNDATILTKKEKEVKKDPILFGVMEHSRKLYYIGDWKDEYCDLTLEDMFTSLGEKVLEINNDNLKTYINTAGEYKQKREKIS